MTPAIYNVTSASALTSASTLTVGQQQLLAGYNPKVLQPPSLRNTVSSSSRQITPQRSNYSSTPLLPGGRSGDAGPDEDDAGLYTNPQVMNRGPPPDADYYHPSEGQGVQSGEHTSRGPSRRSTEASDTSPTPIDPPQFDLDELRKANGHPSGAGKSSINLQSTFGGGNASRRDVRDMGSRKLATREMFVPVLRLP